MSQISLKSISGITSITTSTGVDNQLTLHTNNTTQAFKLDHAGNLHFNNHVNITGVSSASNFKTGTTDLHSLGLTAASADIDDFVSVGSNIHLGNAGIITASSADIDDFVSVGSNIHLGNAGIITASSYRGDGSQLTGINSDLVNDTSPQLGGDLASNGQDILFANNDKLKFGTGNDAAIYHNDTDFVIDAQDSGATRNIYIDAGTVNEGGIFLRSAAGDTMFKALTDSSCFLYFDNALKFRTMTDHCEIRGHLLPELNNTYDLGSASKRFRDIYTQDLQLSNEAKKDKGGNDVDGTWGDWTLQEGEHKIYMINNRTGKKYSLKMEEE